jgi:hypothetical protein
MSVPQRKQKHYYDQHSKDLVLLTEGDEVWLINKNVWEPAKVIRVHGAPILVQVQVFLKM